MPSNCDTKNSGAYAVHHNPPPYFTTLARCATSDVPYTQLARDLAAGTLPAFSLVTPNLLDDMHTGTIAAGDKWIAANLPAILGSHEYTDGSTAVFITWDEGHRGTAGEKCATNKTDESCHIATIVISPSTKPGTRSATLVQPLLTAAHRRATSRPAVAWQGGQLPEHGPGVRPVTGHGIAGRRSAR